MASERASQLVGAAAVYAINAILTSHQLELMKAMVGRLDNGKEDRRAP